jgi:calcium-dependent protein kinase
MLKRLDHPNIIKIYEIYEDEKRFYLITELCSGGELYDELTDKIKLCE